VGEQAGVAALIVVERARPARSPAVLQVDAHQLAQGLGVEGVAGRGGEGVQLDGGAGLVGLLEGQEERVEAQGGGRGHGVVSSSSRRWDRWRRASWRRRSVLRKDRPRRWAISATS